MADINLLLSKLKVKHSGKNQWRACCPAHGSEGGTLKIKEQDSGKITLTCFAGCDAKDILGAIGLDFKVLYVEDGKPYIRHNPRKELDELTVKIAKYDLDNGKRLNKQDFIIFKEAEKRLRQG